MAILYVTEYALMGAAPNATPQMPMDPPLASNAVPIGGTSTMSPFFQVGTRFVRLHTDVVCSVALGPAPTATATGARLAANQTEYRAVPEGGGFRVAVIANT
jgi:hypothetical protein